LLSKAYRQALALAIASGYPTSATIPALLARAMREALALNQVTGAQNPPKPKE
jgi:hypothetical protein